MVIVSRFLAIPNDSLIKFTIPFILGSPFQGRERSKIKDFGLSKATLDIFVRVVDRSTASLLFFGESAVQNPKGKRQRETKYQAYIRGEILCNVRWKVIDKLNFSSPYSSQFLCTSHLSATGITIIDPAETFKGGYTYSINFHHRENPQWSVQHLSRGNILNLILRCKSSKLSSGLRP